MSATLIAVLAVILVAMAFDYTNGFHDAANAIATSVSTRALTPRVALLVAALGNFVGAHFGARVAKTVGSGIGATRTFSAVRWGVAGNIITAWVLTIPAAAVIAGLSYLAVRPLSSSSATCPSRCG